MFYNLIRLTAIVAALCVGISVATADFDGAPTSPQPASQHSSFDGWAFSTDAVGPETWYDPIYPIVAQHGSDCAAPPATHNVNTYDDRVFVCANHVMTSMNAGGGFEQIVMTPHRIFDFCAGPIAIDFDLSTERQNSRDWVDILIQPFEGNVSAPDSNMAAFPDKGILVVQEGQFHLNTIANHQATNLGGSYALPGTGIVAGTNQAAVRQPHRLVIGRTVASMTRMASSTGSQLVSFNQSFPDIGFCQATVSFIHLDYDPLKGEGSMTGSTWHWGFDSTKWVNSTPFTGIKATSRFANPQSPDVHFVAPAPANAFLRFDGAGNGRPQVSYNGGSTWVDPVASHTPFNEVHNYFTPIPAGVRDVRFRWAAGSTNIVRDFEIWSQNGIPAATPTLAPNTPVPTATASSTPTVVPSPILSPVPTSTVLPLPTGTAIVTIPTSTTTPPAITPTPPNTSTPSALTTVCYASLPRVTYSGGKWRFTGVTVPC